MVQLVEDIIKLSQLDETDQVPMEDVDLYRVAKSVLSSLSAKAKQRDVQLQLKGQPTHITGNPALIHSVLYNLSDNAITYNRDGGSVNITITDEADKISVDVKDTGIGISKEEQERIFERFYRIDKSRSRKVGGTGLGLSIVKHALKLHNASINVRSVPDEGTTMTLTFKK